MTAVDTNILIYIHDPRESDKQEIASNIVTSIDDGVLLWRVACEYIAASRKLEPLGYSWKEAWDDIHSLQLVWHTVIPSWNLISDSKEIMSGFHLSFWDALIVSACLHSGVEKLYTEDFDAYSRIRNLEIINPFKAK